MTDNILTFKARPIIFSAPMIRALLAGEKTQTRRVVKPQPPMDHSPLVIDRFCPTVIDRDGDEQPGDEVFGVTTENGEWCLRCPHGKPGDTLWVRETIQPIFAPHTGICDADWKTGRGYQVVYTATDGATAYLDPDDNITERRVPSIHMPRWACRITLEITSVRVERLQDISEADALAEGAHPTLSPSDSVRLGSVGTAIEGFRQIWSLIHGPDSWDANPFVWVIEFRRVTS